MRATTLPCRPVLGPTDTVDGPEMEISTPFRQRVTATESDFEIRPLAPSEALADATFLADWRRVVDANGAPYTLYNSPDWIEHAATLGGASIVIWTIRDANRTLVGVVPTAKRDYRLTFDIANRAFFNVTFKVADILGSQLCIPENRHLYRKLIDRILKHWPECDGICFDTLPADCFCSRLLHSSDECSDSVRVYSPFGCRPWHVITLGASFEEYLQTKSAKTRSTLRRKVRLFEQTGAVWLERYTRPDEVPEFVNGISRISPKTWQHRLLGMEYSNDDLTQRKYQDLAGRGLLRSYLLRRDDRPCAFVIGYQYRDMYYYADVGFDPDLAEFSPGTVLLFLMLEDLHENNRPALLNFGIGDASYKQRFGTDVFSDETVLVLRAGLRNRLAVKSHQAFITCLDRAKKVIGRRVRK